MISRVIHRKHKKGDDGEQRVGIGRLKVAEWVLLLVGYCWLLLTVYSTGLIYSPVIYLFACGKLRSSSRVFVTKVILMVALLLNVSREISCINK